MYPSPNQESVNYSLLVNSKLASMCRMQNRCPFCLDQTTREGGINLAAFIMTEFLIILSFIFLDLTSTL